MYNPKPHNDLNFEYPFQCIWLKLNGSWPLNSPTPPSATAAPSASTASMLMCDTNSSRNLTGGGESFLRYFSNQTALSILYKLWSWYVIISVGITIYFQTAFLINTFGDIIMTTENCCTTLMGALNFVRLLHLRLNQRQFKDIIKQFVKDIWIVKGTHPHVENECERQMNTFRLMTILLCCLILMYCILPLIALIDMDVNASEKPFPYKMLFPYDAHHGWRYAITYIFTSYAGICVVTTLFAEDSIFGFFIIYTCGQFRILHQRIDALIPQAYEKVNERIGEMNVSEHDYQWQYRQQLNQIARMHSTLIEFANRLEHFFNSILLVNFLISSILICMVGFQLVTGKDMFIGDYVKFIVYISSSLSQLYILCWNGDLLIQHASETATHLYACNWEGTTNTHYTDTTTTTTTTMVHYTNRNNWKHLKWHLHQRMHYYPANKEFRTNLQIMLLCSQRPVRITAFKCSTLSLESFTAILSTSLSYFTLLQTLYYENQET